MTSPSDRVDPTVPIGSAIVDTLKAAGPRSATALARRLTLRKANVLVACRAVAAAGQIRRLGKRWALRPVPGPSGISMRSPNGWRSAKDGRERAARDADLGGRRQRRGGGRGGACGAHRRRQAAPRRREHLGRIRTVSGFARRRERGG